MNVDRTLYRVMMGAAASGFLLAAIALARPTIARVDVGLVAFVVFSIATLAGVGWLALDPRRLTEARRAQ